MMERAAYLTNPLVLQATGQATAVQLQQVKQVPLGQILPDNVRAWLAQIRLLEGVPFAHLVADSELLPPESIRFFYLDREWTDVLVEGALSVGTITTLDRDNLQALHASIRDEIDTEERRIRLAGADDDPGTGAAGAISGFLLRSRAVSGWPAMHVRAYNAEVGPDDGAVDDNDPRRLRLLRLERLAPAVLFCLFDGIPQVVRIEEPRQGIQFGVDVAPGDAGTTTATLPLRNVLNATLLSQEQPVPPPPLEVAVPFRRGAPGVVHVAELASRIAAQPATNVNALEGSVQSAEFALEMLRFPYRQVFGDPALGTDPGGTPLDYGELFRPQVGITTIREWMGS
jgi:hypothetical protein